MLLIPKCRGQMQTTHSWAEQCSQQASPAESGTRHVQHRRTIAKRPRCAVLSQDSRIIPATWHSSWHSVRSSLGCESSTLDDSSTWAEYLVGQAAMGLHRQQGHPAKAALVSEDKPGSTHIAVRLAHLHD